jgi:Uma2 family endonuclease
MTVDLSFKKAWTAEEFIVQDQHDFGDAWRYELVDGEILAHAAPAPEHGAILTGLDGPLINRMTAMPRGCRPETGSAATPRSAQRNTARIPDLVIRCGEHPKVSFEVVFPSEIRDWRGRNLKRQHMQAVEGMREIVELFQEDYAVHVYRLST